MFLPNPRILVWWLGGLIIPCLIVLGIQSVEKAGGHLRDETILWLAPPTSVVAWQRFVQALDDEASFVFGKVVELDLSRVAPADSGITPEVSLQVDGRRIRWRWAIQAGPLNELLEREIDPNGRVIAVIGGSTTEAALHLAGAMKTRCSRLPDAKRPILLLHTATADNVYLKNGQDSPVEMQGLEEKNIQKLVQIYSGKTFRFGFDNGRMADLVTRYVLDLYQPSRPRPPFLVEWEDDPYGLDVLEAFHSAYQKLVSPAVRQNSLRIRSGVAALDLPNKHEIKASRDMANDLEESRKLGRPWMVLGGQSDPCRRFLAGLSRNLPTKNHKDLPLIALGDTLGFNRVFLDQRHLWPAEDLPYELVFFCHQDPASDLDGFQPNPPPDQKWLANSTDDLLLWRNIAGGVIAAWNRSFPTLGDAGQFGQKLSLLTVENRGPQPGDRTGTSRLVFSVDAEGAKRFFDELGNRNPGTGEHLVHLEPIRNGLSLRVIEVGQGENVFKKQRVFRLTGGLP